jgi:hypothetical protein
LASLPAFRIRCNCGNGRDLQAFSGGFLRKSGDLFDRLGKCVCNAYGEAGSFGFRFKGCELPPDGCWRSVGIDHDVGAGVWQAGIFCRLLRLAVARRPVIDKKHPTRSQVLESETNRAPRKFVTPT